MSKRYDVAIIGSGPGGYASAIRLRQLGKSVCVIDASDKRLGGVCLNEGCIPVKSLLYSSKLFSTMKKSKDYGIEGTVKTPDMKEIVACSQAASLQLQKGLRSLFKKYEIEFVVGRAKIISQDEVNVKLDSGREEKLEANKIIVATGSSPEIPPKIKVDGKKILTSNDAIKLQKLPKTVLVIGAGPVGVEFTSIFASLGAKLTLVEMLPNILPSEDEDISKELMRILKKKDIDILVNTKIKDLSNKGGSVEAILEIEGVVEKMKFECALIATGRRPNTEGIGLEDVGITLKKSYVVTDNRMRTNIDDIYAVGDIVNTPMYAHVAYKEGIIAAEDIGGITAETIDYESIPNVVFSEPQIASVGLTEDEARKRKGEIAVSKHFFKANGMAVATHREDGFIKIIAEEKTKLLLGVHIIGGEATEILQEFVLAKSSGLTVDDIAKTVHAHPTFSEIAADAAKALFGKPIHG